MIRTVLQIHPDDNILAALQDLSKGDIINWVGQDIHVKEQELVRRILHTLRRVMGNKLLTCRGISQI